MAKTKSSSLFRLKNHPTFFGMHVSSKKSMSVAAALILTGILAPAGMILWLFGTHHKAKQSTTATPKKKRKR